MTVDREKIYVSSAIEAAIKIGLLLLLLVWCFKIIEPFILPAIWGIILAVALFPLFNLIKRLLGGRNKLAATIFTFLTVAVLIIPTIILLSSMIDGVQELSAKIESGTLSLPPPADSVKEWPIIGERTYKAWNLAATNLEGTVVKYKAQITTVSLKLITWAAGAGMTVLQFVLSLIIAGILVANAKGGQKLAQSLFIRVAGDRGNEFANIARSTVCSVAQGLVGIALIQGVLSAVGLLVMNVPAAGVWVVMVIILAIVQLPPILILGPIAAYVFTTHDTTPAVLFTLYAVFVSMSDGFLKPMLLGRGVDVPMLIILLGAIGGMMLSGILGLFVGAVVLSLGYKLFTAWLDMNKSEPATRKA